MTYTERERQPDTTTHDSIPAETGKNDGDGTSGDCISRRQAIDDLCAVCGKACDKSKFVYDAPQDEQVIICPEHYCLCTLPSAQPEQHWIPCSERLPEEYCECLVTYKSDGDQMFMDIVEYEPSFEFDHEKNRFKGNWLFADDCRSVNPKVIAWMPLPEYYQEGGDT